MSADTVLPKLREDLEVSEGPRDHAGRPTWTVHDPLRNRFFQLDENAFKLLCAWDAGTAGRVVERATAATSWSPTLRDVGRFFDFLAASELLRVRDGALRRKLEIAEAARQQSLYQKLIHNYLFFRVPIVRPDPWLRRLYPRVAWLLRLNFLLLSALVGAVSLAMLVRQWDSFIGGLPWFFTAEGAAVFVITLVIVKVLHEMGHALACHKFGVRVASMGVSFIVMWPVLYTDATDGWRLRSRHQRAIISFAGVTTELVLACWALAAWLVMPDGLPRSVAFTVATTTLVMSLAVNLNPFMRFDGYFLLSDLLNMPNLQDRSFALGRWQLRQWLFGATEDPPEAIRPSLRRWLVVYAYLVWLYRFFLFLGIALLVYHMFFKALGVFLFCVEIWYFILRPIRNEVRHWRRYATVMQPVVQKRWYLAGGLLLFVLLFPWRQTYVVQAQWVDARYERIFPVRPGQIREVHVKAGDQVAAGAPLASLSSPPLEQEVRMAQLEARRLLTLLEGSLSDPDRLGERLVLEQDLQRARASELALAKVVEQLVIRAPFAGRVEDLDPTLVPGRWVGRDSRLMTIRAAGASQITALVPEKIATTLKPGSEAGFFGEPPGAPAGVPLTIVAIETAPVARLEDGYFAADHGGEVPVARRGAAGDLVPEISVYRVHLSPSEPVAGIDTRMRGWVHLEGERRTLLGRFLRLVLAALIRESGF